MTWRVQICSERLLPRFGVDRFLLQAGRYFAEQGAAVSFVCLRADARLVGDGLDVRCLPLPPGQSIHTTERLAANATIAGWITAKPDAVVIGGWPFFETAARAPGLGVASIFIDAAAVPHDGLHGDLLFPQLELRRVRATMLPFVDTILPISEFVRNTQTLPDRGRADGVRVVHLGADHLSLPAARSAFDDEQHAFAQLASLRAAGKKIIFNLGRFEAEGYKNSIASFNLLRVLVDRGMDAMLVVLARFEDINIPGDLRERVICFGQLDDAGMAQAMRQAHLGVSMSLWEGFNLPLVEMQSLGKPVLVFNTGAHPEVVAHPWQLCGNETDMARKALAVLTDQPIYRQSIAPALLGPARFPWRKTLAAWWDAVRDGIAAAKARPRPTGRRLVLVDVTNSARDSANSGVIRVTRQTARQLERDERLDVVLMTWNDALHSYVLASGANGHLGDYNGPDNLLGTLSPQAPSLTTLDRLDFGKDPRAASPPLALLPEVVLDGSLKERFSWLRYRGFLISFILHDLIPLYHKQFCEPAVVDGFRSYVSVVRTADQCLSNSAKTLDDFVHYCTSAACPLPPSIMAIWLPAQLGDVPRATGGAIPASSEVRILCVSTLEPRKNHATLLEAYWRLVERRPDLNLRLVLVGNRYAGAEELLAMIERARANRVAVEWLGVISDDALCEQYRRARFTVYPSLVEGFGVPVVESLWMGRPCICADTGVMAELAAPGGCLAVDVADAERLAGAMERLATDELLLGELCAEATARDLATWEDYANRVADALLGLASLDRPAGTRRSEAERAGGVAPLGRDLVAQMLDGHGAHALERGRGARS